MLTSRGGQRESGREATISKKYSEGQMEGRWGRKVSPGQLVNWFTILLVIASQDSKPIFWPLGTFQKGCMGPPHLRRFCQCWETDSVQLPISIPHWALTCHVWLASPGLGSFCESGLLAPGCSPNTGHQGGCDGGRQGPQPA